MTNKFYQLKIYVIRKSIDVKHLPIILTNLQYAADQRSLQCDVDPVKNFVNPLQSRYSQPLIVLKVDIQFFI